jgi:hypothetical protein
VFSAYYSNADITFVDRVFGGELVQLVRCTQCHTVTTRIENALDVSLAIVSSQVYIDLFAPL